MSRVIKFRAWDSFTGKMIHNHEPLLWNRIMPAISVQDGSEYQSYSVMQFTGLTDSNGVEIYESDVVTDHNGIGIVKYSCQCAGFRVSYGDGRAKWFYDYLESERKTIEVIGNIYEHAHLLNHSSEST